MQINPRMDRQALLILALVFVGTVSSSMLMPMMGLFIVDGLNEAPWKIGIYSLIVAVLTVAANRVFGERIDRGGNVDRLLLISIGSFLVATTSLALHQSYLLLVTVGALFLGLSRAALSTMFTLGRLYAERAGMDVARYNSWLRMQTSLAWMVGPALSFIIIGEWGYRATFMTSAALGCLWLAMWFVAVPRNFQAPPKAEGAEDSGGGADWLLLLAASSCVFFALANVLYISAMPMFFIQELGLPHYAPGLSLTTKCLVEVPAIFLAASFARRWGERRVLYAAAFLAIGVFLAIAEIKTMPQLVLTAALEGIYYGTFAGVGITFVQGFADGKLGRATSMYINSLFLGGTAGSLLMGFVATWFDYRTVVLLAAVSAFCALLMLFASRRADAVLRSPLTAASGFDHQARSNKGG